MESAKAFWEMLIPVGIEGGALSHIASEEGEYQIFNRSVSQMGSIIPDDDDDAKMAPADEEGWNEKLTKLWFDFLDERGGKGISKDTWSMVRKAHRMIPQQLIRFLVP
jgi:DCN1-like protein 1/2